LYLHWIRTVILHCLSWLKIRSWTIACVIPNYLRIYKDLCILIIIVSCSSLFHTLHIIHSFFHRNNSKLINPVKIVLIEDVQLTVWIYKHKVRKRTLIWLNRWVSLVNHKSCGVRLSLVKYCKIRRLGIEVIRLRVSFPLPLKAWNFNAPFSFYRIDVSFDVIKFIWFFASFGLKAFFLTVVSPYFTLNQIIVKSQLPSRLIRCFESLICL